MAAGRIGAPVYAAGVVGLAIGKGVLYAGTVASRLFVPLASAAVAPAFGFGALQSALGNTIHLLAKKSITGDVDTNFKDNATHFKVLASSHLVSTAVVSGLAVGAVKAGLIAASALSAVNIAAYAALGLGTSLAVGYFMGK